MENYNTHTRPSPHASLCCATTRCSSSHLFRGMVPLFSTRSTLWHPPVMPRETSPTRFQCKCTQMHAQKRHPCDYASLLGVPRVSLLMPPLPGHGPVLLDELYVVAPLVLRTLRCFLWLNGQGILFKPQVHAEVCGTPGSRW